MGVWIDAREKSERQQYNNINPLSMYHEFVSHVRFNILAP